MVFGSVPKTSILLKNSIKEIKENYDYIIIDCAPSLGILTLNALAASNSIIVPIHPQTSGLQHEPWAHENNRGSRDDHPPCAQPLYPA